MVNNIFTQDLNEEQTIKFYFTTKGVYLSNVEYLKRKEEQLEELLSSEYSSKDEIKNIRAIIKNVKKEIEVIEDLYKIAFK